MNQFGGGGLVNIKPDTYLPRTDGPDFRFKTSSLLANENDNPVAIDRATRALVGITYSHHEIHAGSHYLAKSYFSLAKNATFEFLIVTPNSSKWAHMTASIGNSAGIITATLYKDATYSAIGTEWTTWNRNHNFPNDNTTKIYLTPTITSTGTVVDSGSLGAGKKLGGGASRGEEEKVLAENTIYLVRIIEQNIANTIISWGFDWYEHTSKTD